MPISSDPLPVGGDVLPPEKLFAPSPRYTEPARRARVEGLVFLAAVIDREGVVREVEVLRGLPLGLTDAAVRAVERWRFRPGTLNGRPVAVHYNLTVRYSMED